MEMTFEFVAIASFWSLALDTNSWPGACDLLYLTSYTYSHSCSNHAISIKSECSGGFLCRLFKDVHLSQHPFRFAGKGRSDASNESIQLWWVLCHYDWEQLPTVRWWSSDHSGSAFSFYTDRTQSFSVLAASGHNVHETFHFYTQSHSPNGLFYLLIFVISLFLSHSQCDVYRIISISISYINIVMQYATCHDNGPHSKIVHALCINVMNPERKKWVSPALDPSWIHTHTTYQIMMATTTTAVIVTPTNLVMNV